LADYLPIADERRPTIGGHAFKERSVITNRS
jgi:hypothetical protein